MSLATPKFGLKFFIKGPSASICLLPFDHLKQPQFMRYCKQLPPLLVLFAFQL